MYVVKAPSLLKFAYPSLIWHKNRTEKQLFLTFDDGPLPDVTKEIQNILKTNQIKATFFCVGENIVRNPKVYESLQAEGHRIGNHTFNHLNGFQHSTRAYVENVYKCHDLTQSTLFRPPYSKITRAQIAALKMDFDIVMWDVISGDFDPMLSPEKCLQNVIKHSRNGSIIVFHDHQKAWPRVEYALPRAIDYWLEKGYSFALL